MIGMNAKTGRTITSRQHLAQSIADIVTTPLGSRIMRREYGCPMADLQDWPLNSATRLQACSAITMAIMRWEPRIQLSRVGLAPTDVPGGALLDIEGTVTDTNEALNLRVPLHLGAA